MSEFSLEEKAKMWFGEFVVDVDELIEKEVISIEKIVDYYLRRFPWEREDKKDATIIRKT